MKPKPTGSPMSDRMNTARTDKEIQVGHAVHVAHLVVVWMILVMIAGCGNDDRETGAASEGANREGISSVSHIDDIFTLEREVVLADSIFLAHLTYLDVDADGDFLLTDMLGEQVILYDRNGHHKKTLSTEPCDPGFPWSPFQARFKPDGNIIVRVIQWGYEFSNEGDCIGELSDEFGFPQSMGFGNSGNIYGFYVHGQQDTGYHIKEMNRHGEEIRNFGFDDTYFWYTMRHLSAPDIVVDRNDVVYHTKIFYPQIDTYDEEGNFIAQIGKKPDYYRELQVNDSDFAMGNDSQSASIESSGKFSTTRGLFLLNDETIMIEYFNDYKRKNKERDKEKGLVFMDLEGNDLFNENILTHINFIYAKDGFAYSFYDSTNSGKGFDGTHSIKVYRYLPELW